MYILCIIAWVVGVGYGIILAVLICPTNEKDKAEEYETQTESASIQKQYEDLLFLFTWCIYTSCGDVKLSEILANIRNKAEDYDSLSDEFITNLLNEFVLKFEINRKELSFQIEKGMRIEEEEV